MNGQDHNGKKCYERQWRILGFWIIKAKNEHGYSSNHDRELDENHGVGGAGLWIPADKTGWWTIWWRDKKFNHYIRIT